MSGFKIFKELKISFEDTNFRRVITGAGGILIALITIIVFFVYKRIDKKKELKPQNIIDMTSKSNIRSNIRQNEDKKEDDEDKKDDDEHKDIQLESSDDKDRFVPTSVYKHIQTESKSIQKYDDIETIISKTFYEIPIINLSYPHIHHISYNDHRSNKSVPNEVVGGKTWYDLKKDILKDLSLNHKKIFNFEIVYLDNDTGQIDYLFEYDDNKFEEIKKNKKKYLLSLECQLLKNDIMIQTKEKIMNTKLIKIYYFDIFLYLRRIARHHFIEADNPFGSNYSVLDNNKNDKMNNFISKILNKFEKRNEMDKNLIYPNEFWKANDNILFGKSNKYPRGKKINNFTDLLDIMTHKKYHFTIYNEEFETAWSDLRYHYKRLPAYFRGKKLLFDNPFFDSTGQRYFKLPFKKEEYGRVSTIIKQLKSNYNTILGKHIEYYLMAKDDYWDEAPWAKITNNGDLYYFLIYLIHNINKKNNDIKIYIIPKSILISSMASYLHDYAIAPDKVLYFD